MSARTAGGTEFHFLDARGTHGHMLELYAESARLRSFYRMVADGARDWDGSDPLRFI